jgi:hypothetical protein
MAEMKLPSTFDVRAQDIMVLIYHLFQSKAKFGHMDADYTFEQLRKALSFTIPVKTAILESALYSCNLVEEQGEFWSPEKEKFLEFATRVSGGRKFHQFYNWIEEKKS